MVIAQPSRPTFRRTSGGAGTFTGPWWISVTGEVPQLQIAYRQPDDGRLVQLSCDGKWQWEELGQLVKLVVLLAAPGARGVA